MANYQDLKSRLSNRDVIILDGAIGTQLQTMGAPMHPMSWAAAALQTHPYTVRKMHEDYIKAGADIITTNTYSSARHNWDPMGVGDLTAEMNIRAVVLAQEARERAAKDRPVWIAGAIATYGATTSTEVAYRRYGPRPVLAPEHVQANLREQAEILADAGVDFLIGESIGDGATDFVRHRSTGEEGHRRWVSEAMASVGIPYWVGVKCHINPGEEAIRTGYFSDDLLADELNRLLPLGGEVLSILHSTVEDTTKTIPLLKQKWSGPLAAYPEAGRTDYTAPHPDSAQLSPVTPGEFAEAAQGWVRDGVQIIGGCCGMGVEYIRSLRESLPDRIPTSR